MAAKKSTKKRADVWWVAVATDESGEPFSSMPELTEDLAVISLRESICEPITSHIHVVAIPAPPALAAEPVVSVVKSVA